MKRTCIGLIEEMKNVWEVWRFCEMIEVRADDGWSWVFVDFDEEG
jgi:hypothetical protein